MKVDDFCTVVHFYKVLNKEYDLRSKYKAGTWESFLKLKTIHKCFPCSY